MFKEFTVPGGGKMAVQYDHIFIVDQLPNGGAQIVSVGGAAVATQIPYAEISAWLGEVEEMLDRAAPDVGG